MSINHKSELGIVVYEDLDAGDVVCLIENMHPVVGDEASDSAVQVNDGLYLDAPEGFWARLINHSCNPNCRLDFSEVESHRRLILVARRKIEFGEELTVHYCATEWDMADDCSSFECDCHERGHCLNNIMGAYHTPLKEMARIEDCLSPYIRNRVGDLPKPEVVGRTPHVPSMRRKKKFK